MRKSTLFLSTLLLFTIAACFGDGGGPNQNQNPPLADADSDGIPDHQDNCLNDANPNQEDANGKGVGDACEGAGAGNVPPPPLPPPPAAGPDDNDGDGVNNTQDNCPDLANVDQNNFDGDEQGDACDDDIDGDSVANANDDLIYCANVPGSDDHIFRGNVTKDNLNQLQAQHCVIDGSVNMLNSNLENFSAFEKIVKIEQRMKVENNGRLTTIVMPYLTTVNRGIEIRRNASLAEASFDKLTSTTSLQIQENNMLTSFSVRSLVQTEAVTISSCLNLMTLHLNFLEVVGNLNLTKLPQLGELLLPRLRLITQHFLLAGLSRLNGDFALEKLAEIRGHFFFAANSTEKLAFPSLATIGSDVFMMHNHKLRHFEFKQLTELGGYLIVYNNSVLNSFSLSKLQNIGRGLTYNGGFFEDTLRLVIEIALNIQDAHINPDWHEEFNDVSVLIFRNSAFAYDNTHSKGPDADLSTRRTILNQTIPQEKFQFGEVEDIAAGVHISNNN